MFSGCINLEEVTIPGSVGSIPDNMFSGFSKLNSVILGEGITSIGSSAFSRCTALTTITLPTSLTTIDSSAFAGSGLTSILIPSQVTTINESTFSNCTNLASVVFEGEVTNIGNSAFSGCTTLKTITLPTSLTTIGSSAFANSGLTSISIPNSVKTINDSTFSGCTSLSSVTFNENVTSIRSSAFSGCNKLTHIFIPSEVTNIGSNVFENCKEITIYCEVSSKPDGWNNNWNPNDYLVLWEYIPTEGLTYTLKGDASGYIVSGNDNISADITKIVIPYEYKGKPVVEIGDMYCKSNSKIEEILIPHTVTTIQNNAFRLIYLKSLIIPKNVSSIANYIGAGLSLESIRVDPRNETYDSRNNCNAIIEKATNKLIKGTANTIIPNNIEIIGENAFVFTTITSVTIPDSVKTIENNVFDMCTQLEKIIIPTSVRTMGSDVFNLCVNVTIYCRAKTQPSGWDANWKRSLEDDQVEWGYTGN